MNFDLARHPVRFIVDLCRKFSDIRGVELSLYRYTPQTIADSRTIVRISAPGVSEGFVRLLGLLYPEEEIAFHSKIYVKGLFGTRVYHVPLIDFKGELNDRQIELGVNFLDEFRCSRAAIFSSGRSYHLYANALLSDKEWVNFMGRILLINPPGGPEIVDSRWIGHRLLAGYASLRWTRNTAAYKQPPEFVREAVLAGAEKSGGEWVSPQYPLLSQAGDFFRRTVSGLRSHLYREPPPRTTNVAPLSKNDQPAGF
jgi:hypothetical protein